MRVQLSSSKAKQTALQFAPRLREYVFMEKRSAEMKSADNSKMNVSIQNAADFRRKKEAKEIS
jgi:hypothetical protein